MKNQYFMLIGFTLVFSLISLWISHTKVKKCKSEKRSQYSGQFSNSILAKQLRDKDVVEETKATTTKPSSTLINSVATHPIAALTNITLITTIKSVTTTTQLVKPRNPLLLYWHHPWFVEYEGPKEGTKIGDCVITYNRSRIKEAAALMFHYTVIGPEDIPWKHYRNENQLFIWHSPEGPAIIKLEKENLRPFDGFFNWTKTYRRESDLDNKYGYRGNILRSVTLGKAAVDKVIANKKKLAIWFVSKCDYTYGARMRMKLSQDLVDAGLNVSRYGRCFHNENQLPRSDFTLTGKVIREHKFYLAFENALHCKDYITEKFWDQSLRLDTVPVVWGPTKEDVLSVAPLDSFIFAEDFETPRKLAEYLQFLDSNETEYRKYFRWREDETMTDEKMINMTKLRYPELNIQEAPTKNMCQKIMENKEKKVIKSLVDDFMNDNPKECADIK